MKSQFKSCKASEVFWVDRAAPIIWVMLSIFHILYIRIVFSSKWNGCIFYPFQYVWLERNINVIFVLFSTSSPKEFHRSVSSSHYIVRFIYYVAVHYFLLDCQILCWSKPFTLKCKKYFIFLKVCFWFIGISVLYKDI